MTIDLHALSGAYSIDALSAEEAELFATHLEQCPVCRIEVRELQEVASRMGASESVAPPAALKARILAAADHQAQLPPQVTPIERARARRWPTRIAGAAAAVVLVAAGVLGLSHLNEPDQPNVAAGSVSQVFRAADAHTATVTTTSGARMRVATSAEFGQMAVATRGLPKLTHRTYQMWAVRNGRSTSIGLIDDVGAGKVMPIPTPGTTFAITVEPAGGSKQPTRSPIVEVDPQSV
jgi:anti-sigma-K factor RskA